MTALVVRANAGRLPLPDASVDLVVTSPPYFALRSYTDGGEHYAGQIGSEPTPAEFLEALWACTAEWMRVLKPSGSIWVNLGDKYAGSAAGGTQNGACGGDTGRKRGKVRTALGVMPVTDIPAKSLMGLPWRYAIGCIDQLGLILRAEVIWDKPNGLPESVTDRVRRSHEQWFHFTKQPRYYSAVDEIREPQMHSLDRTGRTREADGGKWRDRSDGGDARFRPTERILHPLGKLPGSVWNIPSEPLTVPDHLGVDHFAAFPTEWPRRIIQGWSPAGGTVADPFGGTGTTAVCASVLGRVGISVDLSHDYSRLAQWRTQDPASRAKAMRVEKPPVQMDGQEVLFA